MSRPRERRCDLVVGVHVVWKTMKKNDRKAVRVSALDVANVERRGLNRSC